MKFFYKCATLQRSAMKQTLKEKTTDSGDSTQNNGESHVYDLRLKGSRNSIAYNGGGNIMELLEDMDTSESEHSDREADDDREWEYSDLDEGDDSGWGRSRVKGRRPQIKRKNSKTERYSGAMSNSTQTNDPENVDTVSYGEGNTTVSQKTASGICCSCSRYSSCKTMKCECRAAGGSCCLSCGCLPTKCSNREAASIKELGDFPPLELAEGSGHVSGTDEAERSRSLASHGAMLLQTALSENPAETRNDAGAKRKPLSDIGNTVVKSDAPKAEQRKKWRKPTFKIVPEAPPEVPKKPESSSVIECDIPLKLPRAMRSTSSNNTLKERNSGKEGDVPAPRSPRRQARATDEKENE